MVLAVHRSPFARTLAAVLQLCLVTLSLSALIHPDDDTICNPVLVLHDHNAHHIGTSTGPSHAPEHCAICHTVSMRSLIATAQTSHDTSNTVAVGASRPRPFDRLLSRRHPARAPPLA